MSELKLNLHETFVSPAFEPHKYEMNFDEGTAFCVVCGNAFDWEGHKMAQEFQIKDSGARQEFSSGMVRDVQTGKADFTRVLDGPMFDRWATHLTKGETKYPDVKPGVPNWTLAAGDEELTRFKKSAFRHFRQWLRGDTDEDHAAAVFFNINGAEYVKAKTLGK